MHSIPDKQRRDKQKNIRIFHIIRFNIRIIPTKLKKVF